MVCTGVKLCGLANALKPGTISKVNDSTQPFPQRENVYSFIAAARQVQCGGPQPPNLHHVLSRCSVCIKVALR
jgi:hypothetical protein